MAGLYEPRTTSHCFSLGLRMAAADKILIATREKVVPDGRANKATVAGNINLTVLI